jgi:hypothetical protein
LAVGAKALPDARHMTVLRYVDVVAVVVVAIPALIIGAPALGYILGAAAWILFRVLEANNHKLVARFLEPRAQVSVSLFARFGRIWLLAGAIVIAGVAGGRKDGLTAALLIFAAYSIAFVGRLMSGPPAGSETR